MVSSHTLRASMYWMDCAPASGARARETMKEAIARCITENSTENLEGGRTQTRLHAFRTGGCLESRGYTQEGEEAVAEPTLSECIREQRDAIVRIAASHGATEVRLIGSVARGEARSDSDVDFLVRWTEDTSLLDHAALMLDLEKLLGRKVDIASDGWIKPSIRESVYRDAVTL